ncbi:hypothetical protein AB1K70_24915 [Bremerella sp. JC770]|uniref:hypothetical protein n=1 Tax=Bremerella sp. JC770 TaxID=3232137 RepID=UPI003458D28D
MPSAEYYRVLWLPKLRVGWNENPVPNSTHNFFPKEWTDLWDEGERDLEAFPLDVNIMGVQTRFHDNAIQAFLELASQKPVSEFTDLEKSMCGELDGVCAFVHPKGAYDYALESDDPAIRIAIFEGEFVCECHEGANVDDPEKKSHVVRVKKRLFTRPVQQFAKHYIKDSSIN